MEVSVTTRSTPHAISQEKTRNIRLVPPAAEQVCIGRAEVKVRGQTDQRLTQAAQELLAKLAAGQKLSGTNYTDCPAWLSYWMEIASTGRDRLMMYAAILGLVTPKLETKALGNLKSERFEYDGGFEYATLWSAGGQDITFDTEN